MRCRWVVDELMMEDTNMLFVSGIWGMTSLARSLAALAQTFPPLALPRCRRRRLARPLPQTISRG